MKNWSTGLEFWNDFSKTIKEKTRFHISKEFIDIFDIILMGNQNTIIIKQGEELFRARINIEDREEQSIPYDPSQMGPPPPKKQSNGRLNPAGINYLYLSKERETCVHEVKPYIGDYVSIGSFKTTRKQAKILNLCSDDDFLINNVYNVNSEYDSSLIPIEAMLILANDYSRPIHPNNQLDYLPVQYFSEYVKNRGYDGIQYRSSLKQGGTNITLFNKSHAKCVVTNGVKITGLNFLWSNVNSNDL